MTTKETRTGYKKTTGPQELGRLFFDLLTGNTEKVIPERIQEVERVWDDHKQLQVAQDGAVGQFDEKSVSFILGQGSSVGVAITLRDPEGITHGSKSITKLVLRTAVEDSVRKPAFTISPITANL